MPTEDRSAVSSIISELEERMSSKIICYLTGDRPNMPTQIAPDVIYRFRRLLEQIGEVESIALFLYSRGGDTNVPWRLVNLIREYCKRLIVLVPFRAHSAATMIALGADRIYMGKMAELSPIDPKVVNPFNPPDPANPAARVPISVEDVDAFRELAERFGQKDASALVKQQAFAALVAKVEPLALGNVQRSYAQIRELAKNLLELHMKDHGDDANKKIDKIVATLTQRLYSHEHLINRQEAKAMGLEVECVDSSLDQLFWKLFSHYLNEMKLERPFNPQEELKEQAAAPFALRRAFIESFALTDAFVSAGTITRRPPGAFQLPPGAPVMQGLQFQMPIALEMKQEGWQEIR